MWTTGQIEVGFSWLRKKPGFETDDELREFYRRLNLIAGIDLPEEKVTKLPKFEISALLDPTAMSEFRETIEWALERSKNAGKTT